MPSKSNSEWLFGAAVVGNWDWSTSISLLRPTALQRMPSNGKGFYFTNMTWWKNVMLKDFVSARLSRFSRCFSVVTKTTDKSLGCNTHPEKGLCRWSPGEKGRWCRRACFLLGSPPAMITLRFLVVRCFEFSSEFPRLLIQTPPGHPSTKVWLMKLLLVSVLYLHLAGSTATQEGDECADSPSLLSVKDVKSWKVSNVEMESVNMSMEEACQKDGSCTDEWACQKFQDTVVCNMMWHHMLGANRSANTSGIDVFPQFPFYTFRFCCVSVYACVYVNSGGILPLWRMKTHSV